MQSNDISLKVNTQMTSGEAFFILQGSPQKIGKNGTSMGKSSSPTNGSADHLLQFELRFDSLKTYLDGFSTVINQHASILNQIQVDVNNRVLDNNLYSVLEKLGTSSAIKDKEIGPIIHPMLVKPRPENTGRKEEDSVNLFSNKLEMFTHGFSHFHQTNVTLNQKLEKMSQQMAKLESELSHKVSHDEMKSKVKKTKKKLNNKIEDNYKNLDGKIKALDAKLDEAVDTIDKKIDENEKKTNHRIKDCEDLLKTRINAEYVDDSVRLLEERLLKEIEKMGLSNSETIQMSLKELAHKIKKCEDNIDDKVSGLKKSIKELENHLTRKLETNKFEEFKKEILARLDVESGKVTTIKQKCEPAIDNLNDEVAQIKNQLKNLVEDIKNIPKEKPVIQVQAPISVPTGVDKDEIDSIFSKYKVDLAKLTEIVHRVEEQVTLKADLSYVNIQLSKKLDISDYQNDNDKLRRLMQMLDELQSKVDKFEELIDKKIAKLKKDLGITDFLKKLQSKAEEENVAKGFENTDKKITTLSENFLNLKKQLDQALNALERLNVQMFSFSDNASLSTKKISPLACLSCGNMSKPTGTMHSVMGIDGKFYKADGRDFTDVYDYSGSMEMKALIAKNLSPNTSFQAKGLQLSHTFSQGNGVKERPNRPQTAGTRGKTQKNLVASSATLPQNYESFTVRPTSAKNNQ